MFLPMGLQLETPLQLGPLPPYLRIWRYHHRSPAVGSLIPKFQRNEGLAIQGKLIPRRCARRLAAVGVNFAPREVVCPR